VRFNMSRGLISVISFGTDTYAITEITENGFFGVL
jgi:hypothetical protein